MRIPVELGDKLFLAFVPLFVFIAILLRKPALSAVNYIINFVFFNRAVQKAYKMRQPAKPKVQVRQTDIATKMNGRERGLFRMAEKLESEKRFVEAAQIFEHIKFQRRAIDILEQNGHIDEACAVLVRMNVPVRAGVIYDRNKMYHKAAFFFEKGRAFDQAAKAYVKLSNSKFEFYVNAAQCFEQAGLVTDALKTLFEAADTQRLKELSFRCKSYDELCSHLRHSTKQALLLELLTVEERKTVVASLALNHENMLVIVDWLQVESNANALPDYLNALVKNELVYENFWREFATTGAFQRFSSLVKARQIILDERFASRFALASDSEDTYMMQISA